MLYKSLLAALLGLSLTGCAVYGGGYGYGQRGYDRPHVSTYYRTHSYPVYVVPRYQPRAYAKHHRHGADHHGDWRVPPRYVPAPVPRYGHHYGKQPAHDWRQAQAQARREGRHERRQWSQRQYRQDEQQQDQRGDRWRGWERQNQQ